MSKTIEVSAAERRRDRRRPTFVKAALNGEPITILDVSLGGFGGTIELSGNDEALPEVGDLAKLELNPDAPDAVTLSIEVIRCDHDLKLFGAHIVEMSDDQFRRLERLTMGRPV